MGIIPWVIPKVKLHMEIMLGYIGELKNGNNHIRFGNVIHSNGESDGNRHDMGSRVTTLGLCRQYRPP